jgi:hypothetical protein
LTHEFTQSLDQCIFGDSGVGYDVACGTGFVQANERRGTWGGTGDVAELRVFGTMRAGDRRSLAPPHDWPEGLRVGVLGAGQEKDRHCVVKNND